MFRRLMMLTAGITAMLAAFSCDGTQGGSDTDQESYYLEFVHKTDTLLVFTSDFEGTYSLQINTNIPQQHLSVVPLDDQYWCSADKHEQDGLVQITPGHATSEDLTATFVIQADSKLGNIEPLTFVVKRLYEEVVPTLTLNYNGAALDGENITLLDFSGNAHTLSFTVETNVNRWKLSTLSDDKWLTPDITSGRNGETVTITLSRNETGEVRNQMLVFAPALADSDLTIEVNIMQHPSSGSIRNVTIREYKNNTVGNVIADKSQFVLDNKNTAQTPFCFVVEVEGQGNVTLMFAEPGGNEFDYTGPGEWMFGGNAYIDPNNLAAGKYYRITTTANIGEARSADAVLLDPDGVELFRFCFTQNGGYVETLQ